MRVELNRLWMKQPENPFRLNALKSLKINSNRSGELAQGGEVGGTMPFSASPISPSATPSTAVPGDDQSGSDCCICLCAMGAFQALFVAPCSHAFHYKCVRPLLLQGPYFLCPMCRTYADLDASVSVDNLAAMRSASHGDRIIGTSIHSTLLSNAGRCSVAAPPGVQLAGHVGGMPGGPNVLHGVPMINMNGQYVVFNTAHSNVSPMMRPSAPGYAPLVRPVSIGSQTSHQGTVTQQGLPQQGLPQQGTPPTTAHDTTKQPMRQGDNSTNNANRAEPNTSTSDEASNLQETPLGSQLSISGLNEAASAVASAVSALITQ